MAKEKETAQKAVQEPTIEELKKKVAEAEARLRAADAEAEEAALKRVCKATGVDYQAVLKDEAKPAQQMAQMNIGNHEVTINGTVYSGKFECSLDVARVIQEAVGKKRMRLIREMTGNDYLVESVAGRISTRLVGQSNDLGDTF